ncbi:unnamed protein product [Cladocopium goreaui]|uniref:Uncharacterized protein n=1 Tax=Cladocopium goreaui TaxID=2562237 RepID=A0A9P1G2H0_9DINO|nr:unnamed protein product [Cladocopium goreaui]
MAMIPMEYKLVSKNSNVGKVFAANGPRWRRCGPEGNQRMVRCWLNGGPPGTTFYLTVAAMVAYKLELVKIDHAGMVFRRCSGKMLDYRFVVRPCGLLRPLSVDLARSGTSIHCRVTALSADLVLDKLYGDDVIWGTVYYDAYQKVKDQGTLPKLCFGLEVIKPENFSQPLANHLEHLDISEPPIKKQKA